MKNKAFNKLSTILIIVLMIVLIIVIVIKFNMSKSESDFGQDNVISMFESDDGKSDDEYTQKTNPDDDGFGTEVGM